MPTIPLHDENLDGNGRIILWITFGLMGFSAISFAIMGAMKPSMHFRGHAFISTAIVAIACAAYYSLAIDSGYTFIPVDRYAPRSRAIFYCRYIDWFFTTPLLLLDILLLANVTFGTALWVMFCDVAMIVLGLIGSVTHTYKYRWGWYGGGCLFQLIICYGILGPGLKAARLRGGRTSTLYLGFASYLAIVWFGYPIVWGLAEGSNTITSDAEAASYAGLDIASKVLFGWALMLCVPLVHNQMKAEEKPTGGPLVDPLGTPISVVWGNAVDRLSQGVLSNGYNGVASNESQVRGSNGGSSHAQRPAVETATAAETDTNGMMHRSAPAQGDTAV